MTDKLSERDRLVEIIRIQEISFFPRRKTDDKTYYTVSDDGSKIIVDALLSAGFGDVAARDAKIKELEETVKQLEWFKLAYKNEGLGNYDYLEYRQIELINNINLDNEKKLAEKDKRIAEHVELMNRMTLKIIEKDKRIAELEKLEKLESELREKISRFLLHR